MNTPLPEFLRGVTPGESLTPSLRGRVILFEFPHEERFPNQRIRQWKLTYGLASNDGVIMPARYQSGKRYHWHTKHNQYFVWMNNEKAFLNINTATVFANLPLYRGWMEKQQENARLIELPRLWLYSVIYRHADPIAGRHTREILVLSAC